MTTKPAPADDAIDALADAHVRTVDARAGFEKMVEKAEPEFRAVATRFLDLHRAHETRLDGMLRALGRTPDTDGSFMGTVNRMVVGMRALLDDIDEDVLSQIRDGEDHVLHAFDEAISADPGPEQVAALTEMRRELDQLLTDTAHID